MASFMQESVVKYACSCGKVNPIGKLFFCRHCLKLRCGFCVCHEVDSHFCSNCLENIPSSEARHKKNCCANCFDCPSCQHTLSARGTTVVVPSRKSDEPPKEGEGDAVKTVTKKVYYLSCLACRWSSRDAGIPDQAVASGAWPESECSYQTRYHTLLEYFQALVLQVKQEKLDYLRRKTPKAHKFPNLTDRTGLTVSMIRRKMGWEDKTPAKPKSVTITPATASADINDLPDDIFEKPLNLRSITTLQQRHGQPAEQPETVSKLYPQRRFLWIKRSLRCRQCEHNIIKSEYHPTSIKYRIQLFASYHIPVVTLVPGTTSLLAGKMSSITLRLRNPTMYDMTITIMELPTLAEELEMIERFKSAMQLRDVSLTAAANDSLKSLTGGTPSLSNTSLTRQSSLNEDPRVVVEPVNAKLEMLDSSFVLNSRDDSAEFDEDVQVQKDEPRFVTWRKANRVAIRLNFTPNADLTPGADVTLGFSLQFNYVNTVTNSPSKEENTHALTERVYIKVGTIGE